MDSFQAILQRIVENLPLPCVLLKGGQVPQANVFFRKLAEYTTIGQIIKDGSLKEESVTCHFEDFQYAPKRIDLDSYGELVLFIKMDQCRLIYDDLTGLLARDCFQNLGNQLLQQARLETRIFALLYMDLDGFKLVNDNWGHEAGDLVLKKTSERIAYTIRQSDHAFRIGGDEFVVILTDVRERIHSCLSARRLLAAIGQPISLGTGEEISVGASIGIATYPVDGQSMEELTNRADEAMYRAKKTGRNNYRLWS
jgi:diguanylate cyclase (GGDEF)-like protein